MQGLRWFRGHWWIKLLDTKFVWQDGKHRRLPVPYGSWDHRRLFRATDYENVSQSHIVTFSCVDRSASGLSNCCCMVMKPIFQLFPSARSGHCS